MGRDTPVKRSRIANTKTRDGRKWQFQVRDNVIWRRQWLGGSWGEWMETTMEPKHIALIARLLVPSKRAPLRRRVDGDPR